MRYRHGVAGCFKAGGYENGSIVEKTVFCFLGGRDVGIADLVEDTQVILLGRLARFFVQNVLNKLPDSGMEREDEAHAPSSFRIRQP